jgi:hypothetical protein
MKYLFFVCLATFFCACNSSSTKKEPQKMMDDTSSKNNPDNKEVPAVAFEPVKITSAQLPSTIRIEGKLNEAWQWTDKMGENILVVSQVAPHDDKQKNKYGEEGQTATLHAVHYKKENDKYEFVWGLNDEEKACPFDITCTFIPGSTSVTDLNKNGYAEIKLQYRMACRSDVSPASMKLMIRENGMDYGLTGNSWIAYSPDLKFDVNENNVNLELTPKLKDEMAEILRRMGRYESEQQFKNAPPEFLTYARSEWLKFVKESFE